MSKKAFSTSWKCYPRRQKWCLCLKMTPVCLKMIPPEPDPKQVPNPSPVRKSQSPRLLTYRVEMLSHSFHVEESFFNVVKMLGPPAEMMLVFENDPSVFENESSGARPKKQVPNPSPLHKPQSPPLLTYRAEMPSHSFHVEESFFSVVRMLFLPAEMMLVFENDPSVFENDSSGARPKKQVPNPSPVPKPQSPPLLTYKVEMLAHSFHVE